MKRTLRLPIACLAIALAGCSRDRAASADSAVARQTGAERALLRAPASAAPATLPSSDSLLSVPLIAQQAPNWCWAASGQMVMQALHVTPTPTQCQQRHDMTPAPAGGANCCLSADAPSCDTISWPDFQKYRVKATLRISQPLSWDEIRDAITNRGEPIAFAYYYEGFVHMSVIYGYTTVRSRRFVLIRNPLPVRQGSTYAMRFESYANPATHYRDYFQFNYPSP